MPFFAHQTKWTKYYAKQRYTFARENKWNVLISLLRSLPKRKINSTVFIVLRDIIVWCERMCGGSITFLIYNHLSHTDLSPTTSFDTKEFLARRTKRIKKTESENKNLRSVATVDVNYVNCSLLIAHHTFLLLFDWNVKFFSLFLFIFIFIIIILNAKYMYIKAFLIINIVNVSVCLWNWNVSRAAIRYVVYDRCGV